MTIAKQFKFVDFNINDEWYKGLKVAHDTLLQEHKYYSTVKPPKPVDWTEDKVDGFLKGLTYACNLLDFVIRVSAINYFKEG